MNEKAGTQAQPNLIRVDFHTHTNYSPDSMVKIEDLGRRMDDAGIDKIAITDHNAIDGALRAREKWGDRIIIGEEVRTKQGELLVFYLQALIPKRLSVEETIAIAKEQGAVICPSHPFDRRRDYWNLDDLERFAGQFDAVEVNNGRSFNPRTNALAEEYARSHRIPGIGGSDGHTLEEIGGVYTTLPAFHDAESLKRALSYCVVHGSRASIAVMFKSLYASVVNRLRPTNRR